MDYVVSGSARIGIIGEAEDVQVHDVTTGDVTFIPTGFVHWIENTSDQPVHFLLILNNSEPQTIEMTNVFNIIRP